MSRWKDHSFCQLTGKILVFLMVILGWLFWEVSKEYKWYPEKFSRNFCRIIGFFGPNAAHASVQFKTLTSVTCIRKKGKPDGQVKITVLQEIHPPVIISNPLAIATEDEPYAYDVDVTDQDIGDTITFSFDDFPSGMTIHSTTGLIQWTPGNPEVGSHTVTVRAQDSEGLADTQDVELTVMYPKLRTP